MLYEDFNVEIGFIFYEVNTYKEGRSRTSYVCKLEIV